MPDYSSFVKIRPYTQEDFNFIKSTFLKNLFYSGVEPRLSGTSKQMFMDHWNSVMPNSLPAGFSASIVCLPDDEYTILGYCLHTTDSKAVVFTYIKAKWRNKGLAKLVIPKQADYYMIKTDNLRDLETRMSLKFEPYYKPKG